MLKSEILLWSMLGLAPPFGNGLTPPWGGALVKNQCFREFEQLSICCRVMAFQIWSEMVNVSFGETFRVLSKTGFLSHNFGSRYASKSIKGSKDADHSVVSKKRWSQKMAQWFGAQGQVNWPKTRKMPPLWSYPQKNLNSKQKMFVTNLNYKICWIHKRFEQLSSSIGWRVITLQSIAKKVAKHKKVRLK